MIAAGRATRDHGQLRDFGANGDAGHRDERARRVARLSCTQRLRPPQQPDRRAGSHPWVRAVARARRRSARRPEVARPATRYDHRRRASTGPSSRPARTTTSGCSVREQACPNGRRAAMQGEAPAARRIRARASRVRAAIAIVVIYRLRETEVLRRRRHRGKASRDRCRDSCPSTHKVAS